MTVVLGPRMRCSHRAPILAPNRRSRCARCGAFEHNRRSCTRRLAPTALLNVLKRRGLVKRDATL